VGVEFFVATGKVKPILLSPILVNFFTLPIYMGGAYIFTCPAGSKATRAGFSVFLLAIFLDRY